MLTPYDILDKINTGENSGVEFKEVIVRGDKIKAPHRDSLSDEFAAFANQSGGVVIFGVVDNTHQIKGINATDIPVLITHISEICHDSVNPPIVDFYVDGVEIPEPGETGEEKHLVYVQIERSLWLHKSKNGYFYRHGNSKREMSTEHVLRAGQSRSQARIIQFCEQFVPNTAKATLQKSLYARFISATDTVDEENNLLLKRNILIDDQGDYRASVAGLLMCSEQSDEYLYNSFICAVCYKGLNKDANYQLDAKDFKGTLDQQIIAAYKFVEKHNAVSARKKIGREDRPQYNMQAIFEAIVNAVVHRDYAKHGSKIRLFMFADRLEICSPGALANTLTVDNLPYNQVTRNELLARLLSEVIIEDDSIGQTTQRKHFLERRGEGVGIILQQSEELSGRKPVYEVRDEELHLTIFAAKSLPDED